MTPQESYIFSASIIAERLTILRGLRSPRSYLEAETAALHVRKIVEGVAFAALSAFEHSDARLEKWRKKDPRDLLRDLESKDLLLLPAAIVPVPGALVGTPDRNVTVSELEVAFGFASRIVHERHPVRLKDEAVAKMCTEVAAAAARLDGWLWNHVTHFVRGSTREAFLVQMGLLGRPGFFVGLTKVGELPGGADEAHPPGGG